MNVNQSASSAWWNMLADVMSNGRESEPRGKKILELLGYHFKFDMRRPVVSVVERKLSRKFLAAEALWILEGDNRLSTIAPYNPAMAKFSDDGKYLAGAYGPRVLGQLGYVVDCLVADHDSRQAVMTIWRENPKPSKDCPCTISVQFLLRKRVDGAGFEFDEIHVIDTMRSSDGWLGIPYDVFSFTMITAAVALFYYERTGQRLSLGSFTLQAGSQHLYETDFHKIDAILNCEDLDFRDYADFDLRDFETPDELMEHLRGVRDGDISDSKSKFMAEFLTK